MSGIHLILDVGEFRDRGFELRHLIGDVARVPVSSRKHFVARSSRSDRTPSCKGLGRIASNSWE
jgi:hypothetical protein